MAVKSWHGRHRWTIVLIIVGSLVDMHYASTMMSACDASSAAIVQCAKQLLDLNKDERITIAEVVDALKDLAYLPEANMPASFIMKCDTDEDGAITIEDWTNPNSTCLPTPQCRINFCHVCTRNGFVMAHDARSVAETAMEMAEIKRRTDEMVAAQLQQRRVAQAKQEAKKAKTA